MTKQLYIVTEQDDAATFVMKAPMSTLQRFLNLHPDAVRRIERETEDDGGVCRIFKTRGPLQYAYCVARAK